MSSMIGSKGPAGALSGGNRIPKGYQQGQLQQFTPEQMGLFQQLFSHTGPDSYLSKLAGGDQSQFEQLEAPAMRQFQQLQGQTASRFSQGGGGMGAMSARGGSGFRNTLNQQTSDFAGDLAARRMGLQRQALQDLLGLSGSLLQQRPYDQFFTEKQPKQSKWGQLIGAGLGGVGGFFAGGPAGALAGSQLGGQMGSYF